MAAAIKKMISSVAAFACLGLISGCGSEIGVTDADSGAQEFSEGARLDRVEHAVQSAEKFSAYLITPDEGGDKLKEKEGELKEIFSDNTEAWDKLRGGEIRSGIERSSLKEKERAVEALERVFVFRDTDYEQSSLDDKLYINMLALNGKLFMNNAGSDMKIKIDSAGVQFDESQSLAIVPHSSIIMRSQNSKFESVTPIPGSVYLVWSPTAEGYVIDIHKTVQKKGEKSSANGDRDNGEKNGGEKHSSEEKSWGDSAGEWLRQNRWKILR